MYRHFDGLMTVVRVVSVVSGAPVKCVKRKNVKRKAATGKRRKLLSVSIFLLLIT